ncbi:MAG: hypothetical protein AAF985_05275 [Bacteroidota bacterium]
MIHKLAPYASSLQFAIARDNINGIRIEEIARQFPKVDAQS